MEARADRDGLPLDDGRGHGVTETYIATIDPAYDIVGTGDYNGDGKSDILWRHTAHGDCGSG